jgi:hypothetical protein
MKIKSAIAAVALLLSATACSDSPQAAAQVCVDPTTNMRVDDSMCRPDYPSFIWWYITPGYTIPAYGYPVAYGYAHPPHGYYTRPAPSSGGVIPKRSNNRQQTVQPTSAATQAPPVKKPSVWNRQRPATQTQPRTQPQAQSKPQWQTYKAPTQSRPVAPRPPTYSKYR